MWRFTQSGGVYCQFMWLANPADERLWAGERSTGLFPTTDTKNKAVGLVMDPFLRR